MAMNRQAFRSRSRRNGPFPKQYSFRTLRVRSTPYMPVQFKAAAWITGTRTHPALGLCQELAQTATAVGSNASVPVSLEGVQSYRHLVIWSHSLEQSTGTEYGDGVLVQGRSTHPVSSRLKNGSTPRTRTRTRRSTIRQYSWELIHAQLVFQKSLARTSLPARLAWHSVTRVVSLAPGCVDEEHLLL